jgi:hypothetical protein
VSLEQERRFEEAGGGDRQHEQRAEQPNAEGACTAAAAAARRRANHTPVATRICEARERRGLQVAAHGAERRPRFERDDAGEKRDQHAGGGATRGASSAPFRSANPSATNSVTNGSVENARK